MTQAILYVVATPLGNKLDITLRAIETLKQIAWIFAEDTRETLKLMELCGVAAKGKKLHSYANHNLKGATETAVSILEEGQSIALMTDRGTPGISDPGALLVAAAQERGFPVIPIPGASAVAALLSVSGIADSEFLFAGFFPREEKKRGELLKKVALLGTATCFYESPRRVRETFQHLKQAFPKGRLLLGREMTKHFEEYRWLSLAESDAGTLVEQGEYALLLEPGESQEEDAWVHEVGLRLGSDREWSKNIAARYGVAAKTVYNALQQSKNSESPIKTPE